jgi:hypothetical protein
MCIAVAPKGVELVEDFVLLEVICHLGNTLADIVGLTRNEAFGGRNNRQVRLAKSAQQVEIKEASSSEEAHSLNRLKLMACSQNWM